MSFSITMNPGFLLLVLFSCKPAFLPSVSCFNTFALLAPRPDTPLRFSLLFIVFIDFNAQSYVSWDEVFRHLDGRHIFGFYFWTAFLLDPKKVTSLG